MKGLGYGALETAIADVDAQIRETLIPFIDAVSLTVDAHSLR